MKDEIELKNKFLIFVILGFTLLALGLSKEVNAVTINEHKVAIVVDGVPFAVENGVPINLSEDVKIEEQNKEDLKYELQNFNDNTPEDGTTESESL